MSQQVQSEACWLSIDPGDYEMTLSTDKTVLIVWLLAMLIGYCVACYKYRNQVLIRRWTTHVFMGLMFANAFLSLASYLYEFNSANVANISWLLVGGALITMIVGARQGARK